MALNTIEHANLWNSYINFSMILSVYKYFLERVEDEDILSVIEKTFGMCESRLELVKKFFDSENIPDGFTDEDVNLNAPRLFSDPFYLYFTRMIARTSLAIEGLNISMSDHSDVRIYYKECIILFIEIFNQATDVLISKGLLIQPPYAALTTGVDYVKKQNFLTGYLGKRRPLLAIEIRNLFYGLLSNVVGKYLLIGFRQVTQSEQVRKYLDRGVKIADESIDYFSSVLKNDDLPAPMTWDTFITDSTISPFSDKLIMYMNVFFTGAGASNLGISVSLSRRHDLLANYIRLAAKVGDFLEDGVNIMIDNGWLEEPPRIIDHSALTAASK